LAVFCVLKHSDFLKLLSRKINEKNTFASVIRLEHRGIARIFAARVQPIVTSNTDDLFQSSSNSLCKITPKFNTAPFPAQSRPPGVHSRPRRCTYNFPPKLGPFFSRPAGSLAPPMIEQHLQPPGAFPWL